MKWQISVITVISDSDKTTNETTHTRERDDHRETSELLRELIANRLELNPRARTPEETTHNLNHNNFDATPLKGTDFYPPSSSP